MRNYEFEISEGVHKLSGFDSGFMRDDWNGCIIEYVRFCIDGDVYEIFTDPNDGYRSYGVCLKTANGITNTFPEEEIIIRHFTCDEIDDNGFNDYSYAYMVAYNAKTNKAIFKIGTDYSDDWYPYAICEWNPQNMQCNEGK